MLKKLDRDLHVLKYNLEVMEDFIDVKN